MTTARIITAPRASTLICGLARAVLPGRWLVPANACPAVPLALAEAGAAFEFVDIDPETLCLDVNLAASRIADPSRPPVSAVVYIRSYGRSDFASRDLVMLRNALGQMRLLVDDRCLCIPEIRLSDIDPAGANAVVFSTGYRKVVDLGGGGYGALFGDTEYRAPTAVLPLSAIDPVIEEYKAAMIRGEPIYAAPDGGSANHWIPGGSGPDWNDLRARIEQALPAALAHKHVLNDCYAERLAGFDPLPMDAQLWRYSIRVANPAAVMRALFDADLFASDHFYPANQLWGEPSAPFAEAFHRCVINLFNDHHFSHSQAEHAAEIVTRVGMRMGAT